MFHQQQKFRETSTREHIIIIQDNKNKMSSSTEELNEHGEVVVEPESPVETLYKPPPNQSIHDLLKKEEEDESLRKYREQLLGAAAKGVPKSDDPRLVVIKSFGVKFPNKEHADIVYELDTKEKEEKLKKTTIVIKESTDYQFFVEFKVQNDIVSALRFVNTISKAGITVEKKNFMMGSYAPSEDMYSYKSPVFTAPSGMLARGSYKARTKFIDDYQTVHLDLEYTLRDRKSVV